MIEVSVIIPCYNAEECIRRCIDSVLAQSFENFEILVVDDASSDGTVSCLRSYDDKRLRIVELKKNSGSPSEPRNVGVREAKGAYIAFLDSDDFWHPEKLRNQTQYMKKSGYQFSCTNYIVREIDGSEHGRAARDQANLLDLLGSNTVGCSTVLIARSLISNLEFRDCPHEDFDMWLRILNQKNSVHGLNEYLTTYVKQKNSRSSLDLRNIRGLHALLKMHGKVGNFGATMLMIRYLSGKFSRRFRTAA